MLDKPVVTSARYTADHTGGSNYKSIEAVINGRTLYVPVAQDNTEYIAIMAWVTDGNTIQEAD